MNKNNKILIILTLRKNNKCPKKLILRVNLRYKMNLTLLIKKKQMVIL